MKLKGSRKLIFMGAMSAAILVCAAAMVIWGDLPSSDWMDLAKWVGGSAMVSFGVGNGIEHIASGKKQP